MVTKMVGLISVSNRKSVHASNDAEKVRHETIPNHSKSSCRGGWEGNQIVSSGGSRKNMCWTEPTKNAKSDRLTPCKKYNMPTTPTPPPQHFQPWLKILATAGKAPPHHCGSRKAHWRSCEAKTDRQKPGLWSNSLACFLRLLLNKWNEQHTTWVMC